MIHYDGFIRNVNSTINLYRLLLTWSNSRKNQKLIIMRTYADGSRMGRRNKTKQNEYTQRDLMVFESKFRKSIEQYKSDKRRNK